MNASERLIRQLAKYPDARKQLDSILSDERASGDIDGTFLGFLEQYEALAAILPRHRIIYDFGAAYGFQAWYFRKHRRYIAINPSLDYPYFQADNAIWYEGTTEDYLKQFGIEKDSFAIVNYVPGNSMELVKRACPYVFVYYPERNDRLL